LAQDSPGIENRGAKDAGIAAPKLPEQPVNIRMDKIKPVIPESDVGKKKAAPAQPLVLKLADKASAVPLDTLKSVDKKQEAPVREQKLKDIVSDLQELTNKLGECLLL
jgi:hypothetical protein